jgi:predicted enzyme related to lactoylglutathione lyase
MPDQSHPIVHLELHTGNLPRACDFYTRLFGWSAENVRVDAGSYMALGLGGAIEGGVVECGAKRPLWLPYVEVEDLSETTAQALELGASTLLEPREGPAGWRSVVRVPAGAEVALWQPK